MSYYIYKKKLWLETSKGDILPLALYADSSIRNDRGHYVYNWCLVNIAGGIITAKEKFKEKVQEIYNEQIRLLNQYNQKYQNSEEANAESYNYYGNVYPGGGRMKHLRSFFSVKHTIPLQEWLQTGNRFSICISTYDKKTYSTIDSVSVYVSEEKDVYAAEEWYWKMKDENPNTGLCIGIVNMDVR